MSADAPRGDFHIRELSLRVPGTDAESGAALGRDVAMGLSSRLSGGMAGQHESLTVRVEAPQGASQAELSLAIQQAIVHALGQEQE